jgi:hypothetical protein
MRTFEGGQMSARGLALVIQRLHDDPGFADKVANDSQATLGPYDLDDNERAVVTDTCVTGDDTSLHALADKAGLQWHESHFHGVGAPPDEDSGDTRKRRR